MGGSSSQPQQPTQTTTSAPSPQASALFNTAFPAIQEWSATVPQRYQGDTLAPLNPLQTGGYEGLIGATTKMSQPQLLYDAATGLQNFGAQQQAGGVPDYQKTPFAGADIRPDLNYNPLSNEAIWNPAANPALTAAIEAASRPVTQQFSEQILPQLRGGAVTAGGFGGSRQGIAEGLAGGKTSQAVADLSAKMANEQYANNLNAVMQAYGVNTNALTAQNQQNITGEQARYATDVAGEQARLGQGQDLYKTNQANLLQSLGMAPQIQGALSTAAYAPYLAQMGYGDVVQQQNQAGINAAVQGFNYDQMAPFLQAQEIMALAQGFPGGTNTSTANVPQANPWLQSLGGAASGAALGSAIMPGIGTGVGAAGGALLPFLMG